VSGENAIDLVDAETETNGCLDVARLGGDSSPRLDALSLRASAASLASIDSRSFTTSFLALASFQSRTVGSVSAQYSRMRSYSASAALSLRTFWPRSSSRAEIMRACCSCSAARAFTRT
jgi:hypothetical protein